MMIPDPCTSRGGRGSHCRALGGLDCWCDFRVWTLLVGAAEFLKDESTERPQGVGVTSPDLEARRSDPEHPDVITKLG